MRFPVLSIGIIILGGFCLAMFSACSTDYHPPSMQTYHPPSSFRFYDPQPVPLKEGTIRPGGFEPCPAATLVNIQNSNIITIGAYSHFWQANLHNWTDTTLNLLADELGRQGVQVGENHNNTLLLRITDAKLAWRFNEISCQAELQATTGNSQEFYYHAENVSPDLYHSCDGAISMLVAEVLNDQRIRDYLADRRDSDRDGVYDCKDECPDTFCSDVDARGCPLDSDGDGIFDYRDQCPDTPAGVAVDDHGCPPDSDGDGITDHRDECPDTPQAVAVDSRGCPLDSDKDSVVDYRDQCPDTPQGVTVDAAGCPLDSDGDGVHDYRDQCPETPMGISVDDRGCPGDSDRDTVADYLDECPSTPREAKADGRGCWTINNIFFQYKRHDLLAESFPELNTVAAIVLKNPEINVEIQGHTDNVGSAAYNLELSEKRARSVMDYLISKNIPRERLQARGYGFSRPRASNSTEEGRALNRRVELAVESKTID